MAREKHINEVSAETKAKIVENSVQNVATKPILTAAELKKQFVKPVVNEDGNPCAISELDRVVEETEAALDEVYTHYEDKTEETKGYSEEAKKAKDEAVILQGKAKMSEDNAKLSEQNALTYYEGSVTAQGGAETARDEAVSARDVAVQARNETIRYNTFAQKAAENAEDAQGKAEAASGLAAAYSTDAETAAERAEYAASQTTGIYRYRGTVYEYQELVDKRAYAIEVFAGNADNLEAAREILQNGDVYNIENEYGDFPAGTNFAFYMINEEDYDDETGWDSLGGSLSTIGITGRLKDATTDPTHRTVTDADKAKWNGKQDKLTFDTVPTAGSSNPVTSGGIKTALNEKADKGEIPNNVVTTETFEEFKTDTNNEITTLTDGLSAANTRIDTKADKTNVEALQRDVADLYAIAEQGGVYTVTEVEDKYTMRETAGGLNIVDGVPTTVQKIRGSTVKSVNVLDKSQSRREEIRNETAMAAWADTCFTNDWVINNLKPNTKYTISYDVQCTAVPEHTENYSSTIGFILYTGTSSVLMSPVQNSYLVVGNKLHITNTFTTPADLLDVAQGWRVCVYTQRYLNGETGVVSSMIFSNLQIEEGTVATPYTPYFKGLKNGSFKGIVSTGRNLISYPYYESSKTENGVTFTVNDDGSVTVNGAATDSSGMYLVSYFKLPIGRYTISGGKGSVAVLARKNGLAWLLSVNGSIETSEVVNGDALDMVRISVATGKTANNVRIYPMLNIGSTALPFEPYTADTSFSLDTTIDLPEYDYIDVAAKKHVSNSATLVLDGTEDWKIYRGQGGGISFYLGFNDTAVGFKSSICSHYKNVERAWGNTYINDFGIYSDHETQYNKYFRPPNSSVTTLDEWKSYLADMAAKGDPITLTYKTAASTETDISIPDKYTAYKHGSETIDQGTDSNEQYGTKITVEQKYYTLAGTTTEGGTNEN